MSTVGGTVVTDRATRSLPLYLLLKRRQPVREKGHRVRVDRYYYGCAAKQRNFSCGNNRTPLSFLSRLSR